MYKIENNFNADTYFCNDEDRLIKIVEELVRQRGRTVFVSNPQNTDEEVVKILFTKDFYPLTFDDDFIRDAILIAVETYRNVALVFEE